MDEGAMWHFCMAKLVLVVKWIRIDEYGSYLYKESYDEMTPFQKVDI